MNDNKIFNNTDDFHNEFKSVKNVLIGNGFCLSHPSLGEAFTWNMKEALEPTWQLVLPNESTHHPESDLSSIRINILKKILEFYTRNLFNKLNIDYSNNLNQLYQAYGKIYKWNCKDFLSSRDNIFTLNYDPILYFEILKNINQFVDGFRGEMYRSQIDVIKTLETTPGRTKVLYIHGCWFIQENSNGLLRKLSFGNDCNNSIESLFEDGQHPNLILEDRWFIKKSLINSEPDEYLKYCYGQLSKVSGELLIFGCSFEKDDHILHALKNNTYLEQIYITYRTTEDSNSLNDRLKSANISSDKVVFVQVADNVIWAEIKPVVF